METTANLPKKIQELKEQGYKIFAYTTEKGEIFYFKKPNKADLLYFQNDVANNPNSSITPAEKLMRKLFCGDNTEEFVQYIEEKPLSVNNILEFSIKDMFDKNFTVNDV